MPASSVPPPAPPPFPTRRSSDLRTSTPPFPVRISTANAAAKASTGTTRDQCKGLGLVRAATPSGVIARSEEHTSELQSRGHLVCRLLLEKKNAATLIKYS